jgi:hypothetical protein
MRDTKMKNTAIKFITKKSNKENNDFTGKLFKLGILFAMVFPILVYTIHTFFLTTIIWRPWYFIIPLIGGISGTHVFATFYLYIKANSFTGIKNRIILLFIIPIFIITANIYIFSQFPPHFLFWILVCFGVYALYHFGRQNIGVLSFACLSSAHRPITNREKIILNGMVFAGMLAAPKLIEVGLLMVVAPYTEQLAIIKPGIPILYVAGIITYVVVVGAALRNFILNRSSYDIYTGVIVWLCVVWYLPLYTLLEYPLLSFSLFTTAHGLQYLVFLGLHAYANSSKRLFDEKQTVTRVLSLKLMPFVSLAMVMYAGLYLWGNSSVVFSEVLELIYSKNDVQESIKLGGGLVAGITIAHYWVDQFIWRFNNPERRAWLMDNYPFLILKK